MKRDASLNNLRILSLVFGTRKVGFSVSYGTDNLIDWGVKHIPGSDKNIALEKVRELFDRFQPDFICLQDINDRQCRLRKSVRDIIAEVSTFAKDNNIPYEMVSKSEIMEGLGIEHSCEKSELLNEVICRHSAMNFRRIEKRKIWESEAYATPYLMAAALPLSLTQKNTADD